MRALSLGLVSAALVAIPTVAFIACGGDTTNTLADAGGGDSTLQDSSMGADTGVDTGTGIDTGMGVDTGMGTDTGMGGDAGVCSQLPTRRECLRCCFMQNPDGGTTFLQDLTTCACTPSLCGATDAAAPDGGVLGTGACADSLCAGMPLAAEAGACRQCEGEVLNPDGGACYHTLVTECGPDPACQAYVTCTLSCP